MTQPASVEVPASIRPKPRTDPDLWKQVKKYRLAYLFISPFFILYAIFGVFPPLYALYLSFFKWDGMGAMTFVGLTNYRFVITDDLFHIAFINNIFLLATATVGGLALAVIFASLIDNFMRRGRTFFLAAYFSPSITSVVAMTVVFSFLFSPTPAGLMNALLGNFGIGPIRWMEHGWSTRAALIVLLTWRWLGYNILLALAGIQNISPEINEAARVDGATDKQVFWYITVPLIRRTIAFMFIVSTIGMLQLFSEPAILVGSSGGSMRGGLGGRDNAILTMVMLLMNNAFTRLRFGYSSAMSYVIFLLVMVASLINLKFFSQKEAA
jgi:cellobiose transport system permease protein